MLTLISSNAIVAALDAREAHRVGGGPAALGRAARVEDLKAVLGALVQRQVRVAEDHGVGAVAEAPAHAREPAAPRAGVVDHRDAGLARPPRRARPAAAGAAPRCRRCRARPRAADRSRSRSRSTSTVMKSPAWTIRSAAAMRSTQALGQAPPAARHVGVGDDCDDGHGSTLNRTRARSSVDRALPSGGRSRRFESCRARSRNLAYLGQASPTAPGLSRSSLDMVDCSLAGPASADLSLDLRLDLPLPAGVDGHPSAEAASARGRAAPTNSTHLAWRDGAAQAPGPPSRLRRDE